MYAGSAFWTAKINEVWHRPDLVVAWRKSAIQKPRPKQLKDHKAETECRGPTFFRQKNVMIASCFCHGRWCCLNESDDYLCTTSAKCALKNDSGLKIERVEAPIHLVLSTLWSKFVGDDSKVNASLSHPPTCWPVKWLCKKTPPQLCRKPLHATHV